MTLLPWVLIAALMTYLFTRRGNHRVIGSDGLLVPDKDSSTQSKIFVSYSYFEKDAIQVLRPSCCPAAQV